MEVAEERHQIWERAAETVDRSSHHHVELPPRGVLEQPIERRPLIGPLAPLMPWSTYSPRSSSWRARGRARSWGLRIPMAIGSIGVRARLDIELEESLTNF